MNLIRCSADCKYQKEGYCNLEKNYIISSSENECCYYTEKNNGESK